MSILPIYDYDGNRIGKHLDNYPYLIDKTAEERIAYSGNVVDTTGKTAPGTSLDESIHFTLPDGKYFSNPWATDTGKGMTIRPKDANGNTIYLTQTSTGQRFQYLEMQSSYLFTIVINGLNVRISAYANQSYYEADARQYDRQYILDSQPIYWTFSGSGYTQGSAIERGFTQTEYNTEYVPYAEPETVYVYTDELNEHINKYSEDVKNMLFEPSMNLLNYSKIVWIPYNGYYGLKSGYYMPVEAGDVLVSNNTSIGYYFYDETYTQISSASSQTPYLPQTAPENAKWLRVNFNPSHISKGDPVMVWKAKSATSAPYERPIFRPTIQYRPDYFDGNLFDYAVPTKLDQGVMRWARFAALRTMNESRDAYRFGTFNTYVSRGSKGFPVIREMLFNYGIDFCGFQECNVAGTTIGAAMYDFQFPYNSGARFETDSVPTVSRFEVTSVDTIALIDGNHYCKVTKMNLPQNKHYPRVPTLSVYNYHGSLLLANRLTEIQTMLGLIANDTSDFIVIMGDTNSEVDSAGHRQSWDAWEAAGFTAVHHGESPTWPSSANPSRYSSMDNIFVSEHINVLHYDIIDGLYLKLEDGTTTLSDHDFVFADLQFDFDAVLKDTWIEPPSVN